MEYVGVAPETHHALRHRDTAILPFGYRYTYPTFPNRPIQDGISPYIYTPGFNRNLPLWNACSYCPPFDIVTVGVGLFNCRQRVRIVWGLLPVSADCSAPVSIGFPLDTNSIPYHKRKCKLSRMDKNILYMVVGIHKTHNI